MRLLPFFPAILKNVRIPQCYHSSVNRQGKSGFEHQPGSLCSVHGRDTGNLLLLQISGVRVAGARYDKRRDKK